MGSNLLDASETAEAFAADVVAFAGGLNVDSLAKLISFFHLALTNDSTKVDFQLHPSGQMRLQIEAHGENE